MHDEQIKDTFGNQHKVDIRHVAFDVRPDRRLLAPFPESKDEWERELERKIALERERGPERARGLAPIIKDWVAAHYEEKQVGFRARADAEGVKNARAFADGVRVLRITDARFAVLAANNFDADIADAVFECYFDPDSDHYDRWIVDRVRLDLVDCRERLWPSTGCSR